MEATERGRLRDRLLARREISPGGCWLWVGARDRQGYGHIRVGGRILLVHRVAAAAFGDFDLYGPECCLHDCDTPACFNPAHLFAGTHADNMADRESKGRRHAPRGSRIGTSKLTEEVVVQIIRALQSGARQADLARELGISRATISKIALRQSWAHVLPGESIQTQPAKGDRHPAARLSNTDVEAIRSAAAGGQRQSAIAEQFGISPHYVWELVNRRRRADHTRPREPHQEAPHG